MYPTAANGRYWSKPNCSLQVGTMHNQIGSDCAEPEAGAPVGQPLRAIRALVNEPSAATAGGLGAVFSRWPSIATEKLSRTTLARAF
jgi:hypothetical protein